MKYRIKGTDTVFPFNEIGVHFPNTSLPASLAQADLDFLELEVVAEPEPTPPTAEELAAQAAIQAAQEAGTLAAKIDALWRAADAYTSKYISGVAVGLLTIGVMQGKPKALAVTAWSSAVWDAYYQRKELVTPTSVDDLDFSTFGAMPYTVPELRAELGM